MQRAGLSGAEGTGQNTQGSRARDRLLSAQAVHPALALRDQGLGPLGSPGQEGSAGVGGQAEGAGARELVLPGHPGTDRGHGSPRPAGRGPTGTHWPSIGVQRGGPSPWVPGFPLPLLCSAGRRQGGLAARASNFSRKGKNPRPRQRLLAQSRPPRRSASAPSAPNIFPKRGAFARLAAGGEGRLCRDWLGSGADL